MDLLALGFVVLSGVLVAIRFGKSRKSKLSHNTLSTVALVCMFPILGAQLYEIFMPVRSRPRGVHCVSHMKRAILGQLMNANEHNDRIATLRPIGASQRFLPAESRKLVMNCPGDTKVHYGVNRRLIGKQLRDVDSPADTIMLAETMRTDEFVQRDGDIAYPHNGRTNFGFVDGHVAAMGSLSKVFWWGEDQVRILPVPTETRANSMHAGWRGTRETVALAIVLAGAPISVVCFVATRGDPARQKFWAWTSWFWILLWLFVHLTVR